MRHPGEVTVAEVCETLLTRLIREGVPVAQLEMEQDPREPWERRVRIKVLGMAARKRPILEAKIIYDSDLRKCLEDCVRGLMAEYTAQVVQDSLLTDPPSCEKATT